MKSANNHRKISQLPRITIVTVCYNSEKTIERAIRSVLNQNYSNLEYIIVDGKSNDNTMSIVQKYERNIDVIICEEDNGIYDAMNKGVDHATGDLIAFLNSDDWYNKGALNAVGSLYGVNHADILYGDITVVYKDKTKYCSCKNVDLDNCVFQMTIPHPGTFVSTRLMKQIKFDINYEIAADYKALLQLYYLKPKYEYVNYNICFFSDGGISTKYKNKAAMEVRRAAGEVAREVNKYNDDLKKRIDESYYYRIYENALSEDFNIMQSNSIMHVLNQGTWYVFGAGKRGRKALKLLTIFQIKVGGVLDNNHKGIEKIDEFTVSRPEDVCISGDTFFLVTPRNAFDCISNQLVSLGAKRNNIYNYYSVAIKIGEMLDDL